MKCRKCSIDLIVGDNWYPSMARQNSRVCKVCHRGQSTKGSHQVRLDAKRRYYERHRERLCEDQRIRTAAYYAANREKVLAARKAQREAIRDPAVQAALKAAIERLNDRPL